MRFQTNFSWKRDKVVCVRIGFEAKQFSLFSRGNEPTSDLLKRADNEWRWDLKAIRSRKKDKVTLLWGENLAIFSKLGVGWNCWKNGRRASGKWDLTSLLSLKQLETRALCFQQQLASRWFKLTKNQLLWSRKTAHQVHNSQDLRSEIPFHLAN